MRVQSFEVVEKMPRKRVEVNVTVNTVLKMPYDLDAKTVVMEGEMAEFKPYVSAAVKAALKVPRPVTDDEIEAVSSRSSQPRSSTKTRSTDGCRRRPPGSIRCVRAHLSAVDRIAQPRHHGLV